MVGRVQLNTQVVGTAGFAGFVGETNGSISSGEVCNVNEESIDEENTDGIDVKDVETVETPNEKKAK